MNLGTERISELTLGIEPSVFPNSVMMDTILTYET
jgi:hypothetical protein